MSFEEVVREKGVSWALDSCKYISACTSVAMRWERKAEEYPEQRYYLPKDSRKSLIFKRNEALNAALSEMRKWKFAGETIVSIPSDLRCWQEDCSSAKSAIRAFLLCENSAINAGLFKAC